MSNHQSLTFFGGIQQSSIGARFALILLKENLKHSLSKKKLSFSRCLYLRKNFKVSYV